MDERIIEIRRQAQLQATAARMAKIAEHDKSVVDYATDTYVEGRMDVHGGSTLCLICDRSGCEEHWKNGEDANPPHLCRFLERDWGVPPGAKYAAKMHRGLKAFPLVQILECPELMMDGKIVPVEQQAELKRIGSFFTEFTTCDYCGKRLPKFRKRFCSDECRRLWYNTHWKK